MILTRLGHWAKLIVVLVLLAGCSSEPKTVLIDGRTMGTTYSIKMIGERDKAALLKGKVEDRLIEINQLMSTYISDSEISQLNNLALGEQMPLSKDNIAMLDLAQKLHDQSMGQFDATLGPLIALWGFGADPSRTDVPPEADIKAALASMGLDGFERKADSVTKIRDIKVDFSAIAKGYGVDELARLVEAEGIENYLVEIGGELRAKGTNARGQVWRIGIEKPDPEQRVAFTSVPLRNLAMATSGDYRNYFEVDGERFSHTLDPSTGYPITHNVASVTVLAETAAAADGYATAINVMGEESGLSLANEINLAVLVIIKSDVGFETRTSEAFDAYLAEVAK